MFEMTISVRIKNNVFVNTVVRFQNRYVFEIRVNVKTYKYILDVLF